MPILCVGCDADLIYRPAVFVGKAGPFCEHCGDEVEAMNAPKVSWKDWRWIVWLRRIL